MIGDALEVDVCSYDSLTRNLSLILPGREMIMPESLKDDGPAPRDLLIIRGYPKDILDG